MWQRLGSFLLLTHTGSAERYWEIDTLRGLAILLMVSYHFVYDLTLFSYYKAYVFAGAWLVWGRSSAILFLVLVGVSLVVSDARAVSRPGSQSQYRHYLVRGLKLIGWGAVISLISGVYMGQPVIIFGILHLIGTSILLAYPFLRLFPANAALGVACIGVGIFLNSVPITSPWLLWLGLRPPALYQLDYFPLLPWFGVVLLGIAAAQYLYPGGSRRFTLADRSADPWVKQLAWLGQRSLLIYLLHQPVFFGLLTLAQLL
jgi:uncharacterized membrane protein